MSSDNKTARMRSYSANVIGFPAGGAGSLGNRKLISSWLFLLAFMIWIMVGLGGYTRDSGSGLSIMHWEPLIGIWPPLSNKSWNQIFALYKAIPQYQILHAHMGLDGFHGCFCSLSWAGCKA